MIKKFIYLLISFLLLFLLISCNQTSGVTDTVINPDQDVVIETTEEFSDPIEGSEEFMITDIAVDGFIDGNEYTNSYIDEPTGLVLYWNNDDTELYIGIESPHNGWVAIGFDPEQAMQGANIILVAMENDTVLIRDDFGNSPFTHRPDEELGGTTDIVDFAGQNLENGFTIEFVIPMNSGDEFDKKLQSSKEYDIILAINSSSIDFEARHTNKSKTKIVLD